MWGEDVILSSDRYRSKSVARAMTYLEVYALGHDALMAIVQEYPIAHYRVRRAAALMALRRDVILRAATKRMALPNRQTTISKMTSMFGSAGTESFYGQTIEGSRVSIKFDSEKGGASTRTSSAGSLSRLSSTAGTPRRSKFGSADIVCVGIGEDCCGVAADGTAASSPAPDGSSTGAAQVMTGSRMVIQVPGTPAEEDAAREVVAGQGVVIADAAGDPGAAVPPGQLAAMQQALEAQKQGILSMENEVSGMKEDMRELSLGVSTIQAQLVDLLQAVRPRGEREEESSESKMRI